MLTPHTPAEVALQLALLLRHQLSQLQSPALHPLFLGLVDISLDMLIVAVREALQGQIR
jgi:hypothetical protein